MERTAPFVYREVYDVPRFMGVTHDRRQFLFESAFNDDLDDYPDFYHVFLLRPTTPDDLNGSWVHLSERSEAYLGKVPVRDVVFDETNRREVGTGVLERLLASPPRELTGAAR